MIFKDVKDEKKQKAFREKIFTYIDRAEKLKQIVAIIKECKIKLFQNLCFFV